MYLIINGRWQSNRLWSTGVQSCFLLLTAKRLESIGSKIMVTLWHTSENSEAVITHNFGAVL